MNFIRQWFCKHQWVCVRNIYGDEIIASNYNRSLWVCMRCSRFQYRATLYFAAGGAAPAKEK